MTHSRRLSPYPISFPESPSRYAPGAVARCIGFGTMGYRPTSADCGRTHQQFSPPLLPLRLSHRHLLFLLWQLFLRSRDERPDGSLPAFAWGDVVYGTTPLSFITKERSLSPSSSIRSPIGVPYGSLSGELRTFHVPLVCLDGLGPCLFAGDVCVSDGGSWIPPCPSLYLLVQACQHLWLVRRNDVYRQFAYASHTIEL